MSNWGNLQSKLSGPAIAQVPELLPISLSPDKTFVKWFERGGFNKIVQGNKQFDLFGSSVDFAEAYLSEIDNLLGHAAEQWVALCEEANSPSHSSAWFSVTLYYFHFFSVSAICRLAGRSVQFLNKPMANALSSLAGAPRALGAGSYLVTSQMDKSYPTQATVFLKKRDGQVHELLHRTLHACFLDMPEAGLDTEELSLVRSLKALPWLEEETWPSELRNSINYVPGFAYRACLQTEPVFNIVQAFKGAPIKTSSEAVEYLASLTPKNRTTSFRVSIDLALEIVYLRSVLLFTLGDLLFENVLKNRKIIGDTRTMREGYLQRAGLSLPKFVDQ